MQFYDFDHQTFQNAIIAGVQDGSLSPVALDRAVSSVLRVKFELGLFDHPLVDPTLYARVNHSPEHIAIALQSARESMTLLKNDNHLLPLSKDLKTIAVIGPNAKLARYDYAPESDPKDGNDLYTALQKLLPNAHLLFADGSNIDDAVAQAKSADAVILALGEWHGVSGEGHDRSDINLPGTQEQLLESVVATGKPAVLVLQNGRPLTIPGPKTTSPPSSKPGMPASAAARPSLRPSLEQQPRRPSHRHLPPQPRRHPGRVRLRPIQDAPLRRRQ